jgi:exo-beta-1,3-glucanase (GH17 family)
MSQANVSKDISSFKQNGILNVRTYAQECNQLDQILTGIASAGGGMTVIAAVWVDGKYFRILKCNVTGLTSTLSSNKNAKAYVSGVLVGNEALFNKYLSASDLAGKITDVKSKVQGLPVGTAETPSTFDPAVISSSDFLVANIHPFFGEVTASSAASNLQQQFNSLKGQMQGKKLIVGETGWPTAGDSNGQAVPSVANLQTYVKQIQCVDKSMEYYFFDSYDSPWKAAGNLNVEQHWGIWQANGASKGINLNASC